MNQKIRNEKECGGYKDKERKRKKKRKEGKGKQKIGYQTSLIESMSQLMET